MGVSRVKAASWRDEATVMLPGGIQIKVDVEGVFWSNGEPHPDKHVIADLQADPPPSPSRARVSSASLFLKIAVPPCSSKPLRFALS